MPSNLQLVLIVLCSCLWTHVSGQVVVKQMHVITRHGSRTPLGKDASNLQENTPGSLTPFGERQMYDLGRWIADAYNATGVFHTYSPSSVRLESSAYDRTLVSANNFALGAFSNNARDPYAESLIPNVRENIPVYSIEPENDIYLRAYDKCETYHQRLEALYTSPEWLELEQRHAPLLTRLAQLDSFRDEADATGKIPLTNVWNVYDSIHVATTECTLSGEGFTQTCLALENPADRLAVNATEFQELEVLTNVVEQMRYGPEIAGRLLGGPLLLRIIDRMLRNPSGKFFLYSAHYPTILGVLSALDEQFPVEQTIPEYASALIFILQQDMVTMKEYVRVVYKGDSQLLTPPVLMTLDFCLNEAVCPVDTFATRWTDWSVYEWCKICNNRNAAVCLDYWLEETEAEDFGLDKPVQTGLFIGFVLTFSLSLLVCFCCSSTRVKWDAMPPDRQETAPTPSPSPRSNDDNGNHSFRSDSMSSVEMNDTIEEVSNKESVMV